MQETKLKMTAAIRVAFQGEPGANSHIAVTEAFPSAEAVPLPTFEDCFAAIEQKRVSSSTIVGWDEFS